MMRLIQDEIERRQEISRMRESGISGEKITRVVGYMKCLSFWYSAKQIADHFIGKEGF